MDENAENSVGHPTACVFCGLNNPFDLPRELIDAAHSGELIIFAGAGVSTEVPAVFPSTLYSEIVGQLPEKPVSTDFPDVMSAFESTHRRSKLIEEIWRRFDYVNAFGTIRNAATRFHRELATMPYIMDIITTNWDPYFEEECGALPIVTGSDYALVNIDRRKVYKIHGSINVISSIIATREDYNECLQRLAGGALGGTIRHLIATRPIVFVGYSLADPDFRELYTTLTKDLGKMQPMTYCVTPFPTPAAEDFNMKQIVTDGTFFLHKIKESIIADGCHLPDSVYGHADEFSDRCHDARVHLQSIDHSANPGVLYCYFYLDGVQDATDRIRSRRVIGEYSNRNHVRQLCLNYEKLYDKALERGRFDDAAYIDGYSNAIISLLLEEDDPEPPTFFCFTSQALYDIEDARRAVRNLRRRNKDAWMKARQISQNCGPDTIPFHAPFLYGVLD